MAKKLKAGKVIEQKGANVVLTMHAMQKNVQQQFVVVNTGLASVKKKYNPQPEISAMVGMVDTVPAVAKYVFKQVQPLLESGNVKSIKTGVKIVVEVVKAHPEGGDDALRIMKSLLISRNSSEMTKKAAVKGIVEIVKAVPALANSAFGQINSLLKSRDADTIKTAIEIIVKMVKAAPQVEVAQEALEVVQGLLGSKNADSFKAAMKIIAEVVQVAPTAPQIEGGILKTLVTIVRNAPQVEVAKEALELAKSLAESGNANLIQTAARIITNVVKTVPRKAVVKEALSLLQPLLQGDNADSIKIALDAMVSIVQLVPSVALAKHVFKLIQPVLESENADFVQMAAKTVMDVVRTLPQVEIAQEALSLVQVLIANKNVEAVGIAIDGIVKAVPQMEVAHRALSLMQPLLESDNPAFVKMATKTVTDIVKTVPQVEIAQGAVSLVQTLIANKSFNDAFDVIEAIVKAVPQAEVAHRVLSLVQPLLESDNPAFVQTATKTVTELVRTVPQLEVAQEALSLMQILIANKNIFAAHMAIETIIKAVPKTEVAHKVLSLVQPILESDNPQFVKVAARTVKEVVRIVPEIEVAHASLSLVQTLIANKSIDVAQETIEGIVKAVPQMEIAHRALSLVQPLIESENTVLVQMAAKTMVGIVKAMPKVEVAQEVLGRMKPLLESKNASLIQIASKVMQDLALVVPQVKNNVLEVMSELFKAFPQMEVAQEVLKQATFLLGSKDAASAKIAIKTMTEVVAAFPSIVNEAFTMLKPLLLDNHAKALANEAIVGIVQALPTSLVAYSALGVVSYGQEDYFGNIRAEESTAKTVVEIVRAVPEVTVARCALDIPNRWLDIMASDSGKAAAARIMSEVVGIVPQATVAESALGKLCSLFRYNSLEAIKATTAMIAIVKAVPEVAPRALSITHSYIGDNDLMPYALSGIVQFAPHLVEKAFGIIQYRLNDRYSSAYTELRAAKALALIVETVPQVGVATKVLKLFKPLIGSKNSNFSSENLPCELIKIVKALPHPEVVQGALELAQLAYNSVFQSRVAPSVIREIMEIVPTSATAAELRKVVYHLNQQRGCNYDSFKLGVSLTKSMIQKLLHGGVSAEEVLEQINPLVGGMFSAPEAAALAVQVVQKNPTLKVAEKALAKIEWILKVIFDPKQIECLSKEGYAPKVAKALIEVLQAVPEAVLAKKALGLVKSFHKKYAPEVTKIVIEIVKIDPKLVKDVVQVLIMNNAQDCAVELLKAMPWLASEAIEKHSGYLLYDDKAAKRDIAAKVKVQPEYDQYAKGVNAQVQGHLVLGYLGDGDLSEHVSKALGVVDGYVPLGDDLVY